MLFNLWKMICNFSHKLLDPSRLENDVIFRRCLSFSFFLRVWRHFRKKNVRSPSYQGLKIFLPFVVKYFVTVSMVICVNKLSFNCMRWQQVQLTFFYTTYIIFQKMKMKNSLKKTENSFITLFQKFCRKQTLIVPLYSRTKRDFVEEKEERKVELSPKT